MKINISGIVKTVKPLFESGNFKKRILIIENLGETYAIDFHFSNVEWLNDIKVNDMVNCSVTIQTREHNGNFYTTLLCRALKTFESKNVSMDDGERYSENFADSRPENSNTNNYQTVDGDDDLPF